MDRFPDGARTTSSFRDIAHNRHIKMEMVPLAENRERQRRRLTRSLRPRDPSVTDPLLGSEVHRRTRRAPPLFGDKHVRYTATYSSYEPPQPIGLDLESEQKEILDDYLFFDGPAPHSRVSLKRTLPLQRENPAVDMGGFFSYGCCCIQCVRTQEIGITENFGQFQEILAPGFYCMAWPFSSIAGRLSLRVQQLDVVCETKTKDNVFVQVQVSVQYKVLVEKAYDAFYRLMDPGVQIRSYAYDVVRSTVPRMTIDEAFVSKSCIADNIMERLYEVMKEYGYQILGALVTNLTPDDKVKMSMNEIEASKRLKAAIPHRAEAEKVKVVKKAEAFAEAMYISGVGVSKSRMALAKGMKESMRAEGKSVKEVMDLLLVSQYLETLAALQPNELMVRATPGEVFAMQEAMHTGKEDE